MVKIHNFFKKNSLLGMLIVEASVRTFERKHHQCLWGSYLISCRVVTPMERGVPKINHPQGGEITTEGVT